MPTTVSPAKIDDTLMELAETIALDHHAFISGVANIKGISFPDARKLISQLSEKELASLEKQIEAQKSKRG